MNGKRNSGKALISLMLVLVMLLTPIIGVMPTYAYDKNDTTAPGTGTALPSDAEVYDGTASDSLEGKGTKTEPYLIADAADFMFFRSNMAATCESDEYFKLTGNIYLNNADYGESGKHNALGAAPNFRANLDGAGYTIYNIYDRVDADRALFATVSGTIKNLNISGVRLRGSGQKSTLALSLSGTIENVHITNADISGRLGAGVTIAVMDHATITNTSVAGKISGSDGAGGIIYNYSDYTKSAPVRLVGCTNNADVTSSGGTAAGMLANTPHYLSIAGVEFVNCTNNGDITAKGAAGGIAANAYRWKSFMNYDYCVNTGDITSTTSTAGGIVAANTSAGGARAAHCYFRNCINYGAVKADASAAGGIIGHHCIAGQHAYVIDSANYGTVDGKAASGGIAGRLNEEYGNACNLYVTNSANYGAVGSAGFSGSSGHIAGTVSFICSVVLNGFIGVADIEATEHAAALVGADNVSGSNGITASDVWIRGNISATSETGRVAAFFAGDVFHYKIEDVKIEDEEGNKVHDHYEYIFDGSGSVLPTKFKITNSFFDLTFSVNGTTVPTGDVVSAHYVTKTGSYDKLDESSLLAVLSEATMVGYNDGTADVTTEAYPAADPATFAASALAALNAAAGDEYNEWVSHDTYVAVFKLIPITISNVEALNHRYNEEAVEVSYVIGDTAVKSVSVTYYNKTDLSTPLTGAPANPGEYRVILQGKDALGADYGGAVSCDYVIEKGVVQFELVVRPTGLTGAPDYNGQYNYMYSTTFSGDILLFTAKAYSFTDSVRGETLIEEMPYTKLETAAGGNNWVVTEDPICHVNTYRISFTFPENEFYEGTTKRWKLEIMKGDVSYPDPTAEGRWTLPTVYNGTEQKVVFNSVDGDADVFDVALSGDIKATNATADGVTLTATATLTLKDMYKDDCNLVDSHPVYEVEWRIERAPTSLKLYDPNGNPVEDATKATFVFDGTTHTYTVKLLDENGNPISTIDTIPAKAVDVITETITAPADAVDENHARPEALQVIIEVTPELFVITVTGVEGRPYNGTAIPYPEDTAYSMTDTTGSVWDVYQKAWEKWNADTETWEAVAEAKQGGKYRLHVTRSVVAEDGVTPSCAAEGYSDEITITRIKPVLEYDIDMDVFAFELNQYVTEYTGAGIAVSAKCSDLYFTGTITVEYSSDGETYVTAAPVLSGTYQVRLTFNGDENYLAADPVSDVVIRIDKKVIRIPTGTDVWNYTAPLAYTGAPQSIGVVDAIEMHSGIYLDYSISGNTMTAKGSTTATIYIWSRSENDIEIADLLGNPLEKTEHNGKQAYTTTIEWTIREADVSLEGVAFAPLTDVVFDGDSHYITVQNLPAYLTATYVTTRNGVVVEGVTDSGVYMHAGDYVVTVTFALAEETKDNYTAIPAGQETMEISFTVAPMTIDSDTFTFTGTSAVYNGNVHLVEIENLPAYLNATYVYYADEEPHAFVDAAGTYTVVATLSVADTYEAGDYTFTSNEVRTTLTIARKPYPASAYAIDTTYYVTISKAIAEQGAAADFLAQINAQLAQKSGSVNTITVANGDEIPVMKEPGKMKFDLRLAGSPNYEEITTVIEVTLVVNPTTTTPNAAYADVSLIFPEGVPEDLEIQLDKVEVSDALSAALQGSTDIPFENAIYWGIWKFSAVHTDGSFLENNACEWVIRIELDKDAKAAVEAGNYHVAKVTGSSNVTLTAFNNCEYDATEGVLLLRLTNTSDLNASYTVAIAGGGENALAIVLIIAAIVMLLILLVVILVIIVKKKKSKKDESDTAGEEYVGYVSDNEVEFIGSEEYLSGDYYAEDDTAEPTEDCTTGDTSADSGDDTTV